MQQPPNYYGNSYTPQPTYPSSRATKNNDYPLPNGDNSPIPYQQMQMEDNVTPAKFNPEKSKGMDIVVYATFPDSATWHDKVFKGEIVFTNDESMMLYDPDTKRFTTIPAVYINYVEFTNPAIVSRPKDQ